MYPPHLWQHVVVLMLFVILCIKLNHKNGGGALYYFCVVLGTIIGNLIAELLRHFFFKPRKIDKE